MTPLSPNTRQALTPLLTPIRDGTVDMPALDAAIDRQIVAGMDGIVVGDVVGEGYALTSEEHDRLVCTSVTRAARHLGVIVAAGSNCTGKTIERCQRAQQLGADALLVTVPYYSKPTCRGVIEHFRQVAASVFIPVIVDDDPSRTGIDHGYPLYAALAELDIITGICHGPDRLAHLAAMPGDLGRRYLHLTRDDRMLPAMLAAGCGGALSAIANIIPSPVQTLVAGAPDPSLAMLAETVLAAASAVGRDDVAALKAASSRLYPTMPDVRLPLVAPEPETIIRLRQHFALPGGQGETAEAA